MTELSWTTNLAIETKSVFLCHVFVSVFISAVKSAVLIRGFWFAYGVSPQVAIWDSAVFGSEVFCFILLLVSNTPRSFASKRLFVYFHLSFSLFLFAKPKHHPTPVHQPPGGALVALVWCKCILVVVDFIPFEPKGIIRNILSWSSEVQSHQGFVLDLPKITILCKFKQHEVVCRNA